jgi:hypothetical protein
MSELQFIESALGRAARRRRWERALRGMWFGVLAGSILWLLALATYKLLDIPSVTLLWVGLAGIGCLLLGLIIGGWRKPSLNETARWIDIRQHLKERLSTALEVSKEPNAGSWSDLVVADAASHAKEIEPRKLVPFSLPRATRWAAVVLAVAFGLGFVPEYRSKASLQKKADEKVIREVGKQLTDLTRRELAKRTPALEQTQKSLESVGELGDQLQKKSLSRTEALKDLANASDKLKEQLKEMGKDPALKRLEQAARAASGNNSQTAEGLQKQMEAMQKQLGTPTGNPEAMEKLQKQLDQLQEAAKAMADKNSPGNDAEKQKMSAALSALSKQAQEMGLQLPQIDQAIDALANNQTDLFLRDLQAATTDLEKMRDMAKSLQQMQQQMEKMGKDLAEQLKNGQAEAAQQTLQKMISQLQQSGLSQEQLQQIMKDVASAVQPGSQYGKVGEHLKQASQQMQKGDNPGASQSLANAAKELENLMQQMGDAQSMMASLDALQKASQCVGTGQSWGQCQNPGVGQGGKPGSGVGTWADENSGWMYDGQWSDRWDNSGIVRPDQDPRGVSDRGDGEVKDSLVPTKVKGQFSPGGQMPSITLKGVSIKGQSSVQYEQSVTAAQSDAQSALSQEKVPRAYQGAVKDYFDDLKK